jgi:hypothetical protein
MSHLIAVFALPAHITSVEKLPDDFQSILGSRAAVLGLLADLFPDADFSDPTWVTLEREDFVIEFIVGTGDPVESVGLRIHGADSVMDAVHLLCQRTGWRAYDASLGALIDFAHNPAKGLQAWRSYAERVIRSDAHHGSVEQEDEEAHTQSPDDA